MVKLKKQSLQSHFIIKQRGRVVKIIEKSATALFLTIISFCILAFYKYLNLGSAMVLLITNLLFFSLIYYLKSRTVKKIALMAIGNIAGLLFSLFYQFLASQFSYLFGSSMILISEILFPFSVSFFAVSFWSYGLTFLYDGKNKKEATT